MLRRPRVLVIDDEPHMLHMLEVGLESHHYEILSAGDGRSGLDLIELKPPDVIILDLMLPDIDGTRLVPMIRRLTEAPIVMLSARKDASDKIDALAAGADDYVAKPFDLGELAARLRSHLRRPQLIRREEIVYADVVMDIPTRTVARAGKALALTAREFDLLATLLQEPGRVFTREQLLDRVWGRDATVEPNVVDTYVSYLRSKLGAGNAPRLIRTIRYIGYTARID